MRFKNKLQVLLISPLPPPIGGIAIWTINLLTYFSDNENIIISHLNNAVKLKRITSTSIFIRIISGVSNFIYVFWGLAIRLVFHKPDVIHLTSSASLGLFGDSTIVLLSKLSHVPIITHWHFGRIPKLSEQKNWEWKMLCNLVNKSNRSIVIDNASYTTLLKTGHSNIVNIPNPISHNIEQKAKIIHDQYFKRPNGKIIFVGHVIKAKGVFELVEACLTNFSINELLLIGPYEPNMKKELMKIANKRDNGTWLKLIGPLDKDLVLEQMCNSSILALPSYTEGFPGVVIEAMAMGCAIIATEVGAISEMIDSKSDKPCGICVPIHDIEILKKAIEILIKDPIKAEIMGKRGTNKVLNYYTPEKIILQYQNVWVQVSKDPKNNESKNLYSKA